MTATLTVLSGPLAGTRLEIEDSADEVLVGSDPDCRLALDVPGVSPIHARLWLDGTGLTVHDTRSPYGLFVNDARVEAEALLHDGDVLWLGTPGDETSVMIQCRVEGGQVAPAAPVAAERPAEPAASPLDEIEGLLADVPTPPAVAPEPPSAAPDTAPDTAADDVFFMDESPPVPAPPARATPAPLPRTVPDEPAVFEETAPPPLASSGGDMGDELFFVEEPEAAPPPVDPPPLPVRPAPAVATPASPPPRPAAPPAEEPTAPPVP
ncbi:MAG TPA: FHA domain-containing protein, partial [Vicinamibacteria bacterium]|nr:FHA domain-containing protein [Vicinamibacteria bacterium]